MRAPRKLPFSPWHLVLLVFFFAQRYLIRSVAATGLAGL
jgi:hypothetical protein